MAARDDLTHAAPLGLRFWDEAATRVVADALGVRAHLAGRPERPAPAARTASGAYALHRVPGLEAVERGEAALATPAAVVRVLVDDPRGDFLPVSFACAAPQAGFAAPAAASLTPRALAPVSALAPSPSVPLFASPSRAVAGAALVRAELRYAGSGAPAAWALVELRCGATLVARALADAGGRVAALFPYPPVTVGLSSPASWALALSACHGDAAGMDDRADLDRVFAFDDRPLRLGASGGFATTLSAELRPGRMVDLGLVELQA